LAFVGKKREREAKRKDLKTFSMCYTKTGRTNLEMALKTEKF